MTKEEAKIFIIDKDIETNGKHKWRHHVVFNEWVDKLINKIYDDFENRVCKNCKWFNPRDNDCQNTENYQIFGDYDNIVDIPMQTTKYFGCIRFERKNNEL